MAIANPDAAPLLREWRRILGLSIEDVLETMTDPRPRARTLRQVTPFAGALSARERARLYREFRVAERAAV